MQVEGGFLAGTVLGLVPFAGFTIELLQSGGILPKGSPPAERGLAVGQILTGIYLMVAGVTGEVDERSGFKPSDFPWLGTHALIMRRAAMDALRDILEANGEILPLSTDDGVELFVFNARVIDALDEAKSSLERFPETNRIMYIKNLALFESAIVGADLFRLPHRASSTYVTDRFVERVTKAGLRGLKFNKVWSSR